MPRLLIAAPSLTGVLAGALVPLLAGSTALAQAEETAAAPGRATGLYARGSAGAGFADSFDQDFSYSPSYQPIVAPPTAKSTDIGGGAAWSAAVGFQYARTRTEIEYRRFDLDADEVALTGGAVPSAVADAGDITAQAIMSNVYFDLVNSSRLTPYVGAGVGGARVENELGERDAAFAYQGRVGVELEVSRSLSVGVEYSYFRTLEIAYGPEEFDASVPPTPTFSPDFQRLDGAPFAASSVMASLRWVF
ncbi:MAG: P44/Msp2 family outer membrane protein [Parvularculaceae bacterium]|nr:P44/Msp2 family outer membrane protein [Parvularculaceae bacterium]